MKATLRVRDLLIASWEIASEELRNVLPEGVHPAEVDGRLLVSLVGFRVRGGRVGRLPVLPFSQLNVRTYVTWKGEPAVFFLASRVTAGGLPGSVLGAPYRLARIRARSDRLRVPGFGISIAFRPAGPGEPGSLGRHELGLFENNGLRAIRVRRGEAEWKSAELAAPAKADVLLALGLETRGEPSLLYTEKTDLETEVPPERV